VSHRRWRRGASHQGTGRYSPSAHLRPCSQHRFRVRGCRKPWAPTVRQTAAELQAMDSRGTERAFSLTLPEVAPRSSWMPDGSSWTWSSHGLRSLHSGALWRSPRQARHRSAPRESASISLPSQQPACHSRNSRSRPAYPANMQRVQVGRSVAVVVRSHSWWAEPFRWHCRPKVSEESVAGLERRYPSRNLERYPSSSNSAAAFARHCRAAP
jgi:hypothetical protein